MGLKDAKGKERGHSQDASERWRDTIQGEIDKLKEHFPKAAEDKDEE
jgi:hypothetical protein